MFTPQPIGIVESRYRDANDAPKDWEPSYDVEGMLAILPAFELGLTDWLADAEARFQ